MVHLADGSHLEPFCDPCDPLDRHDRLLPQARRDLHFEEVPFPSLAQLPLRPTPPPYLANNYLLGFLRRRFEALLPKVLCPDVPVHLQEQLLPHAGVGPFTGSPRPIAVLRR